MGKINMSVRRIMAVCIMILFMFCGMIGCGNSTDAGPGSAEDGANNGRLSIVTTIFPEYDWVMNVLGEQASEADVTLLLDDGVDPHSFQPAAQDIMKVSSCDVFVYIGGESDFWVEDALEEPVNPDRKVVRLIGELGDQTLQEELAEGMQAESESADTEQQTESAGEEYNSETAGEEQNSETAADGEEAIDEHIWLSLPLAQASVRSIARTLGEADPDHAAEFAANADSYCEELDALNGEYESMIGEAARDTILVGDRFPFLYMVKEYGLSYYAAFQGCSAETEASFSTIAFLAGKADELHLPCVLTLESSDQSIARTIVENTKTKDQKILRLNSMQTVTGKDADAGMSYISIMRDNLEVLKEALN